MSKNLLVARYENNERLLLISGVGLTSNVITNMPGSKRAYTPAECENVICGRVAIGVGSLEGVTDTLKQLTNYFSRLGLQLDFRGQTAVPVDLLPRLKTRSHLCGAVIQTMEREAREELGADILIKIDYKLIYDQLVPSS